MSIAPRVRDVAIRRTTAATTTIAATTTTRPRRAQTIGWTWTGAILFQRNFPSEKERIRRTVSADISYSCFIVIVVVVVVVIVVVTVIVVVVQWWTLLLDSFFNFISRGNGKRNTSVGRDIVGVVCCMCVRVCARAGARVYMYMCATFSVPWSKVSRNPSYDLSIGTSRLCDERDLMVDPLKLFWVITNSTYLGRFLSSVLWPKFLEGKENWTRVIGSRIT